MLTYSVIRTWTAHVLIEMQIYIEEISLKQYQNFQGIRTSAGNFKDDLIFGSVFYVTYDLWFRSRTKKTLTWTEARSVNYPLTAAWIVFFVLYFRWGRELRRQGFGQRQGV